MKMSTDNPTSQEELKPRFLDIIENGYASEDNPRHTGIFIRSGYRSGRVNPGKYWVLTDGDGDFWEMPAKSDRQKIVGHYTPKTEQQASAEFICCEPLDKALGDHKGLYVQSIGSLKTSEHDSIICYVGGEYTYRKGPIIVNYCPFCGTKRIRLSQAEQENPDAK
jgi:hypothetical protein